MLPENLLTRAAGAAGMASDIDLESEDFNRRFRVARAQRQAGQRRAAAAHDGLPRRLPDDTVPSFRLQAAHLIAWRDGRLEPADVVRTCAVLDRVIDGIPSFVWRDAGLSGGYDPAS